MKSAHESVNLFGRIIEREGSARSCRNTETFHQRLGAMMAGANGDTFAIEDGADVVRMYSLQDKGQGAGLLPCCSNDPQTFDSGNGFGCIREQMVFVRGDVSQSQCADVIQGGA